MSYDYYRTECGAAGVMLINDDGAVAIEGFSPCYAIDNCEACEFASTCQFYLAHPVSVYLTCGWDRVEEILEEILGDENKEEEQ